MSLVMSANFIKTKIHFLVDYENGTKEAQRTSQYEYDVNAGISQHVEAHREVAVMFLFLF